MSGHQVPTRLRAPDDLLTAIDAAAAAGADAWFAGLDAAKVRVSVVTVDARARCFLYRVMLDDGRLKRPVVVKVRHSQPELRRIDRSEHQRPLLTPERTLSDLESARREYDALQDIAAALAGSSTERFGVLRALAWLPEQTAIVMDQVLEPTLRDTLLETSRLRRPRRSRPMDEAAWRNAGAWLRVFHDHESNLVLPTRVVDRNDIADLYGAYSQFMLRRLGPSPLLTNLGANAVELVKATLPSELPLRPGHGDFVANNMFLGPAGRVTVFDPLPRWRVPLYQDLATLVMGTRLLPTQAASLGMALPRAELARYEAAVLAGYFGAEPAPLMAVRAYQLLVLLDRWSALVSKRIPRGHVRPHLHEVRVRVATRHFHREARRLYSLLTSPAGQANSGDEPAD